MIVSKLWKASEVNIGRNARFFLISLSHTSLMVHYKTNFDLMQHHKYSLNEIDEMMPWEKEVYVNMLIDFIKEEELRMQTQGR